MKKYQHENDLQSDALEILMEMESHGLPVFGSRSSVYSGRVKSGAYFRTGRIGLQDLTWCVMGMYVALEAKLPKCTQSDEQIDVEALVKAAGGQYFIFHSLEELVNIIQHLMGGGVNLSGYLK